MAHGNSQYVLRCWGSRNVGREDCGVKDTTVCPTSHSSQVVRVPWGRRRPWEREPHCDGTNDSQRRPRHSVRLRELRLRREVSGRARVSGEATCEVRRSPRLMRSPSHPPLAQTTGWPVADRAASSSSNQTSVPSPECFARSRSRRLQVCGTVLSRVCRAAERHNGRSERRKIHKSCPVGPEF